MRFILLLLALMPLASNATMKIDINKGNSSDIIVAFSEPYISNTNNSDQISENILSIVRNDLVNTGFFKIIIPENPIYSDSNAMLNDFPLLAKFDVTAILGLSIIDGKNQKNKDAIRLQIKLFDSVTKKTIVSRIINANTNNHRRLGHIVSDTIYSALTGDSGYFDTQILYIARENQKRYIAIVDQDGANKKFLTTGSNFASTPRVAPQGKYIVYTSYSSRFTKVILRDLKSGSEKILWDVKGITSAPRFSPDGKSIVLSHSLNGRSNLYTVNLLTGTVERLTNDNSINTSPSFSPDQSKIVFNSDRNGRMLLYTMIIANHSKPTLLSQGKGSYAAPIWSPRGDYIAFIKIYKGNFYLGVMEVNGGNERILSRTYMRGELIESPTWSPNGRVIIFARERMIPGKGLIHELNSIDVTGFNEHAIDTRGGESLDPEWSSNYIG
ncbi:MAG: hypothetical protein OEY79_04880 [Anaplasmataceae bacterium]|nr:hypothetical protein [Anaplasmataceae bacterium]